MAEVKKMNAIVSTSIRFSTPESVAAYKALPLEDLPEDDMWFDEVARYIVGYKHIFLFGATGRRLATFDRGSVKGFAIDGQPIVVHGEGFKRIDSAAAAEGIEGDGINEDDVEDAVAEQVAAELAAEDGGDPCEGCDYPCKDGGDCPED